MASSAERSYRLEELMPLIEERLSAGEKVSFFPRGTSMLPLIRQGKDSVELSPLPDRLKKYDLPLYRRKNGQFVLHRIIEVSDTYTCMGDNQLEAERGLEHGQMIALVTAFTRNGRRVEVESGLYRLYCRLWVAALPLRRAWKKIRPFLGRIKRRFK